MGQWVNGLYMMFRLVRFGRFPLQPVGFWTLLLEAFVCTPGIAGPGTMKVHVRGNFWESLKGRVLYGGEESKFQSLEPKMMEDSCCFWSWRLGWVYIDRYMHPCIEFLELDRRLCLKLLKSFATILLGIWCSSIHLHLQLDLKTFQKKSHYQE